MKYRVLVADDDNNVLAALKSLFSTDSRIDAHFFADASSLFQEYKKDPSSVAAVLLDCHWGIDNPIGIEIASRINEVDGEAQVLMMSRDLERKTLKEAYRRGQIADFIDKPLQPKAVLSTLNGCFAKYDHTRRIAETDAVCDRQRKIHLMGLEGTSQSMAEIWETISSLKTSLSNVLILGENGTGKGEVAKTIHRTSPHGAGPFVAVNCGAISHNLIESELFGHKKGAFTGATENSQGKFLAAHNGTIFLDEIGELPLELQVKLLNALQDREVYPVGSVKPIKINARVIAATNRDLEDMVRKKAFREDLFFRLNVVPIVIPPLRERPEDIKPIVMSELKKYPQGPQQILQTTLDMMEAYEWPGNVRELVHMVERWANLVKAPVVQPVHLNASFFGSTIIQKGPKYQDERETQKQILRRKNIWKHLPEAKSIRDLAKRMGVSNSTAQTWLKEENIDFYKAKAEAQDVVVQNAERAHA